MKLQYMMRISENHFKTYFCKLYGFTQ